MATDPDYLAFRELVELAKDDPALAAAIERLMQEGADLASLLALRPARYRDRCRAEGFGGMERHVQALHKPRQKPHGRAKSLNKISILLREGA